MLLAQVALSASLLTGARSTGKFREGELIRLTGLTGAETKDLVWGGSEDHEVDHGNRIVERLTDKQLPRRDLASPCMGS